MTRLRRCSVPSASLSACSDRLRVDVGDTFAAAPVRDDDCDADLIERLDEIVRSADALGEEGRSVESVVPNVDDKRGLESAEIVPARFLDRRTLEAGRDDAVDGVTESVTVNADRKPRLEVISSGADVESRARSNRFTPRSHEDHPTSAEVSAQLRSELLGRAQMGSGQFVLVEVHDQEARIETSWLSEVRATRLAAFGFVRGADGRCRTACAPNDVAKRLHAVADVFALSWSRR